MLFPEPRGDSEFFQSLHISLPFFLVMPNNPEPMRKKPSKKNERISLPRSAAVGRAPAKPGSRGMRGQERGLGSRSAGRHGPPSGRVVAGIHACAEVLKVRPEAISEVWMQSPGGPLQLRDQLAPVINRKGVEVRIQPIPVMDRCARGHQGLLLFVNAAPSLDWNDLVQRDEAIVLVLDGIEDPQNFGAILRTAWLMEVSAILVPKDRAVGLTATVVRVASGGAEHVPVVVCNTLQEPVKRLKDLGFWVFGLAEQGRQRLWQLNLPERVVWVIGAEDKGIRSSIGRLCDELVCLPQAQTGSSYNASVATSLATFETLRQWQDKNA